LVGLENPDTDFAPISHRFRTDVDRYRSRRRDAGSAPALPDVHSRAVIDQFHN
jgi:hypothetical protein